MIGWKKRKDIASGVVIVALLLSVSLPCQSAEISRSNGHISIKADNEPFDRVMKDLGKALGCKVIMPVIKKPVSISRSNVKLSVVFRDLLRSYQHAIYWVDDPAGKGEKVDKIVVMSAIGTLPSAGAPQLVFEPEQAFEPEQKTTMVEMGVSDAAMSPAVERRIDNLAEAVGTNNEQQKLEQALQDPSADVRIAALDILVTQERSPEARQLIESALADIDPVVRKAAREMLAYFDETPD